MKIFAVILLAAFVAYVSGAVAPDIVYRGLIQEDDKIINLEDVDTDGGLSTSDDLPPIRHRRVTCDVLSLTTPWGGVNHAACAVRCIAQRHKGGACRGGVCHCRG